MPRLIVVCLLALALSPAHATAQGVDGGKRPWLVSLTSNYGAWSASEEDNAGYQYLQHVQISYETDVWGLSVTGKAADTSYKTSLSSEKTEFRTMTDTVISGFYNYNISGLTVRAGVDASLPTGKSAYTNDELDSIITDTVSQDLMLLNSYGGGLNIIPNLMVVGQANERMTLGAGVRYEFTGEYDPTVEMASDKIDPGDRMLLIANGAYMLTEKQYLLLVLSYSRSGADTQEGTSIFQVGDTYSAEGRYVFMWTNELSTVLGLSFLTQGKNMEYDPGGPLNAELANSNNNLWDVYVNNSYKLSRRITLTGMAGYRLVFANGYEERDALYDAGRTKFYIEPGVMFYLKRTFYVTGKLRYTSIRDKKDAFSAKDEFYNLVNADISLVYSF